LQTVAKSIRSPTVTTTIISLYYHKLTVKYTVQRIHKHIRSVHELRTLYCL